MRANHCGLSNPWDELVDPLSTEPTPAAAPPRWMLISVLLISCVVVSLEVTLTRVLSATLKYHYSFLVVSVAVCGLGLGGMLAYFAPRAGRPARAALAAGLGLTTLLSLTLFFRVMLVQASDSMVGLATLVGLPFTMAGAFLALAFRRWWRRRGWSDIGISKWWLLRWG
jgi:hypothetical protein